MAIRKKSPKYLPINAPPQAAILKKAKMPQLEFPLKHGMIFSQEEKPVLAAFLTAMNTAPFFYLQIPIQLKGQYTNNAAESRAAF